MAETVKHTPGPFEVQNPMGDDVGLWVVQAGLLAHEWSCIAIVPRDEDRSGKHFITRAEQKANADLFAAAPDLLEALKKAKDTIRAWHGPNGWEIYDRASPEMKAINEAIAKAEGRP